jgi:hypothetical protein
MEDRELVPTHEQCGGQSREVPMRRSARRRMCTSPRYYGKRDLAGAVRGHVEPAQVVEEGRLAARKDDDGADASDRDGGCREQRRCQQWPRALHLAALGLGHGALLRKVEGAEGEHEPRLGGGADGGLELRQRPEHKP